MSIKFYKGLILSIFGITICLIALLTFQAIYETDNWAWFQVDYTEKDNIISSYGTLIGGVLAFLSILFVLFQVYEQREQIENDKKSEKQKVIDEHQNLFRLLSSFLDSIIIDIKGNGSNLKDFYEAELRNPTLSNQTYFTVNKNFNRIIEMNYSSIYKSFEYYFANNDEWEKDFLNFYRSIDFYKDITPHLQENYRSQIQEKIKLKYQIQENIQKLLMNWNEIRNNYITSFPIVFNRENLIWFHPINKYFNQYREYIDYMEYTSEKYKEDRDSLIKPLDSDLTDLRNTYYEPLFNELLLIAKQNPPEYFGENQFLMDLGNVIAQIKNLENFAINYAKDLKLNVELYFTEANENLKKLDKIKNEIEKACKKKL